MLRQTFVVCFKAAKKTVTSYYTSYYNSSGTQADENRLPRRFTDSYSAHHATEIIARQRSREGDLFEGLNGVHMLSQLEVSSERARSDDAASFRNYEAE